MSFFILSQRMRRILASLSPSPDGGDSMVDITYSDLVTAIGGSTLVPGTFYRITDYATKHFIVDGGGTQYLVGDGIITGATEPLIVLATSTNTIDKEAYSPAHPEDVIYYDWNPANWLDDLSFADLSGVPTIISGFKGVITFRHDTLLDNYAGFDWRGCKFRRWKTNATAWSGVTAYTAGEFVSKSSKIYIAVQNSTNKDPDTQTAYWIVVINLSVNEYWNVSPGTWLNIPTDDVNYNDFNLFAEGTGTAIYTRCCRNNHFLTFKDNSTDLDSSGSLLPNNVVFLTDDDYFTCYVNTIESEFFNNTIMGNFSYNRIGGDMKGNILSNGFYYNDIGSYFVNNIIYGIANGNSIGAGFLSNNIGSGFKDNEIGADFSNNVISSGCQYNKIGHKISTIYTNQNFQMNNIYENVLSNLNLSAASHVYATYTCWIYTNQSGTARLEYIDGSDATQYAAPTA